MFLFIQSPVFLFQDLPVQKQSDQVQDFYHNAAVHFSGEFSQLSAGNKLVNIYWSELLQGLSIFADCHIYVSSTEQDCCVFTSCVALVMMKIAQIFPYFQVCPRRRFLR